MFEPHDDATAPPSLAGELRNQRALLGAAGEALRRQAALLRVRRIEPPTDLLDTIALAESALVRLAESVAASEAEIDQLRALNLTSALINSSLDVDTVLAQALDELIALTGADRGFIVLAEPGSDEYQFRIARGPDPDKLHRADVSRTLLRQVLTSGQPILTDNAADDPKLSTSDTVARFQLRSVMCVPLVSRGAVEGAIYVDNRLKTGVFEDGDLALLSAFANQAAVALHNAQLYGRVQETMGEINRARALIENVFASIGSGVITTDASGRVLMINPAAAAILQREVPAAIGQPLGSVLPLRGELAERVHAAAASRQSASFEAGPEIAGRGRLALSLRVSPLTNAEGDTEGAALVFDDLTEQQEREETLRLMTRYLPPGMVENIQQIAELARGGERREVTCAFITTCSFSAFPPGLRPAETMAMLNVHLDAATACIHRARGIVDKYLGSDIMVLFNTQLNPELHHAEAAVRMALDLRAAFRDLDHKLGADPAAHHYTIGIHSGIATLGNVGSLRRRSFTALGDTINLAKRVHESARAGQILITSATADRLTAPGEDAPRIKARPALQARGRQQATAIFEVFGD